MVLELGIHPAGSGSRRGHRHTGGARALRRHEYLALLLAGRLAQVALVLVALPVGAAHGHVVAVALGRHRGRLWLAPGSAQLWLREQKSSFTGEGACLPFSDPHCLPPSLTLQGNHSKTHKSNAKPASQWFDSDWKGAFSIDQAIPAQWSDEQY